MITKISQRVFFPPWMSCRRKTSTKTVKSSQNQITQRKKMNIVHRTSRNG